MPHDPRQLDFQALFDAIPGAFWVVDADDYCIVAVSDEFLRVTRQRREDVIDKPLFEVFPGDPRDARSKEGVANVRASLERVKTSGKRDEMTLQRYPIPRPAAEGGGFEERFWSPLNAPVFGRDGQVTHIVHRTEDVTYLVRLREAEGQAKRERERFATRAEQMEADVMRRAEELKRLNDHLEFAQKVASVGSWEYDVRDGKRTWSDEVYRILGLERGAFPENDKTLDAVVHPEDRKELDAARRQALAGEIASFEHRIVRPDGEVRHVQERAELVTDDNGKPLRLFGTVQDITEQKRAQERVLQSDHLLRVAGEMAKLGAWQLDVRERCVKWSEEVFRIYEMPVRPSISLEETLACVAPEWRDHVAHSVEASVRDGEPVDETFEAITGKGRRVWVHAIGSPVWQEGKVVCVQGALQDITREKRVEAEVRKLSEQLTATLESITDGFATIDNNWRISYLNQQAERIMQRGREELLGRNIWEEYPELVGTQFEEMYRTARSDQQTVTFEDFFPPLGIWLEVTVYPAPEGLAVYFRDISQRKQYEAAHREQAELTSKVIENSLDAVINIDTDSIIRVWNTKAEKIFGWSADDALGQRLYELIIPPEYREAHRRGVAKFVETGTGPLLNTHTEVTALHRSGKRFPVELAISPIASGDSYVFSAFIRDITERKRAEEAAHESEQRFRTVARVTTDTIWDWNLTTGGFWWNDGISSVFGYDGKDIENSIHWWEKGIHPDDRERVLASIDRVLNDSSDDWRDEYRFQRSDGSYAVVVDRGFVIRDPEGKPVRMIGALNDITARKEHEKRLAQQAALLDKAREAIIVLDMQGRITYWNKAAENMYGWRADEARGRLKHELLHEDGEQFRKALEIVRERGEWTGEVVQRRRNGDDINVEVAWSLVTDDEDRPTAIFSIINDITERLALEEQLRQSQRLEAVGQLTGGVAHDFNNLLTVILGNAELLVDQLPDDSPLRKLAEMSRSAAERGSDLTHRLLAFARRQALAPQVADVNKMVIGMETLLRRTLPETIDLETVPVDDAWPAYVDPAQLESALLNLAINAKDAMPGGGMLTIETANARLDDEYARANAEVEPGDYVMVAVSDTGSGISPEIIDRVFDPFFTTKEKGKGTGLGLSMVYGFAKQSAGHIKIYSEPDQGTTVRLYLPRADESDTRRAYRDATQESPSGSETILVVEDDDLVREHASRQLEMLGYEVLAASNGPEALDLLDGDRDVDLLFTDVIMSGGMNGPELAEAARKRKPDLKVLYTSGYTENAIVHHGRLDSDVQLLQKPYQRAELARAIRDAIHNGSEQ